MILLHIFIALFSVIFTGITSFFPSKGKLTISYIFVGLTIVSGTYLVVMSPAHMISACFEGLIYVALVTIGITFAQRRLAKQV